MICRTFRMGLAVAGLLALAASGFAQSPAVVTSFSGNGHLAWTNAVNTNARYRVEWSSRPNGPWYRSFQKLEQIDGGTASEFEAEIPMFYRVVVETNEPPAGMAWIDEGEITLGKKSGIPDRTHYVSGFRIDRKEVSLKLWQEVYTWATNNNYTFDNAGAGKGPDHPVVDINWYDAVKWCNARSEMEGLTPVYEVHTSVGGLGTIIVPYRTGQEDIPSGWVLWSEDGYRLPTQAEWEKAARGGRDNKRFPWGDFITHDHANYEAITNTYSYDRAATNGQHPIYDDGISPATAPVGSFPPNGFGLYDMAGNVQEWVWNWDGSLSLSYQTDPRGPGIGTERMILGGDHRNGPFLAASGFINAFSPDNAVDNRGFRCVRSQ